MASRKTNSNKPPGRSVSFDDTTPAKIITVEDLQSFSADEKDAIWYNPQEIHKLQKQVKKLILNKEQLNHAEDTDRGLEYHVAQHRRELAEKEGRPEAHTKNKQKILKAVRGNNSKRNIHNNNNNNNNVDMEQLAQKLNQEALLQSGMLAAQDTAEAYSIYLETMDAEMVNKCFQDKR